MTGTLVLWAALAAAGEGWRAGLAEARKEAEAAGRPILAEFTAVWCYSCYYMDREVLGGPAFRELAGELVLLKLDVDEAEGRRLKAERRVRAIPTFLLLEPGGDELGRIVGEQTEAAFLAELRRLLSRRPRRESEALREAVEAGRLEEAERLRAASLEAEPGLARSPEWRRWSARAALLRSKEAGDREGAARALAELAALEPDCATAYDVSRGLPLWRPGPELEALRAGLSNLVEERVLARRGCADRRSAVEALAELHGALGEGEARRALLDRAAAVLREGWKAGEDRNLDDDLRRFLELAGRHEELDRLYPELARAWPADYVYAYRYARNLLERGRDREGLEWAEKAERLCYGAGRLRVTEVKARLLRRLGRGEEAEALLRRDLKAAGGRFPEEAAKLKELLEAR